MQDRNELTTIQAPLLLKNVIHNKKSIHLLITADYHIEKIAYDRLSQHDNIPIVDAKKNLTFFSGGMLDSHVHGQGGYDFGAIEKIHDVEAAALALGKTGLSYALATVPSLDPNWCELCIIDQLPIYVEGALFKQLPGKAKSAYLIVKNKLYYADKLAEEIIEIKSDETIIKQLTTHIPTHKILNQEQLDLIKKLTQHERITRGLPLVLKTLEAYMQAQDKHPISGATKIIGVHLEGPFIAHNCKGAHDERVLQDSIDYHDFISIIASAPFIKNWKVTLAPDLSGAVAFMQTLHQQQKQLEKQGISIKINVGHSNASKALITQFMELGAAGITHCGNACKEPACRNANIAAKDMTSNVVQWVLENPDQCPKGIELIVDGHHLSESFVKLIANTIGHKINLVTDALGPTGLEDGRYVLGTLPIYKKGGIFYLADPTKEGETYTTTPPTLAGGAAPLYQCAKRFSLWACGEEKKQNQQRLDAIYCSGIQNPRISSLSSATLTELENDHKNGVFFNHQSDLVLSLCHGKLFVDEKEWNVFAHQTSEKKLRLA